MSHIELFKNNGLKFTGVKPYFVQTKIADLEKYATENISKRKYYFNRIVMAVRTNDRTQSIMLTSEIIKIKVSKRNLCVALKLFYHYNTMYSK